MPRRKPASSKQRKAELQLKRAIKRGDIPAPPSQPKPPRGKKARARSTLLGTAPASEPSSKRLQSAFLKVEKEYLERSRFLAATELLPRPLPARAAVLDPQEVGLWYGDEHAALLTCPKRPKWRFDMAKKEVDHNESVMFQKWSSDVDSHVDTWRGVKPEDPEVPSEVQGGNNKIQSSVAVPSSPTFYERNLEVWRQLWRVTEISQILLLLLDSRCPALHFPPSLHTYLASLRPIHPLVLVLTKSDLVPAAYTAAWSTWLQTQYPHARIVKVESYREQPPDHERKGQGQRKRFDPEIKQEDLNELVKALKAAHLELLAPPERVRDDVEKLKKWKPNVRQSVDWAAAQRGGRAHVDQPAGDTGEEYITIGLIGQPNVGKSSLLNALFGAHKVKASRTPGKTKHFQTLFWTPEIRLVDCPGLVMPNFVHMELQVLCGILPISQIPSIPSCIRYALRLLPLERILHLTHPTHVTDAPPEDKRTWRGEGPSLRPAEVVSPSWTTMDVLMAYATVKGWITAKAGRPDVHRAGNALLRALAEGKIRWAFWPPDLPLPASDITEGNGIWLGDTVEEEEEADDDEEDEEGEEDGSGDPETEDEDAWSDQEESGNEEAREESDVVGSGRFGALMLEEEGEEPAEAEDEE